MTVNAQYKIYLIQSTIVLIVCLITLDWLYFVLLLISISIYIWYVIQMEFIVNIGVIWVVGSICRSSQFQSLIYHFTPIKNICWKHIEPNALHVWNYQPNRKYMSHNLSHISASMKNLNQIMTSHTNIFPFFLFTSGAEFGFKSDYLEFFMKSLLKIIPRSKSTFDQIGISKANIDVYYCRSLS